jgi:glycyl-tRNA synthetase beta chain
LLCHFEKEFLTVPQAALISTMEANQRVFPSVNEKGVLQNYFVVVANIESQDPASVIRGNEKVVRARLSDAKFFYDEDLKIPLENHLEALKKITFQQGLGSLFDKTERLVKLVPEGLAQQAARFCKTDLLTQMVQEFPELQGYMGHQYALMQGKSPEVALAIEDHYKPKGRGGELPSSKIGVILALADKVDTLVGLFSIGKEPTSSGDPYALRRQALGVIAILIDCGLEIDLEKLLETAYSLYHDQSQPLADKKIVLQKLQHFFKERFEVWCRDEKGLSSSVVSSVVNRNTGNHFALLDSFRRAKTLTQLLKTEEGESLKELAKRIFNILETRSLEDVDIAALGVAELSLWNLYRRAVRENWLAFPIEEQYRAFLSFKAPIADFFESVLVNDLDSKLKANRQNLLRHIHALFQQLADFSKL